MYFSIILSVIVVKPVYSNVTRKDKRTIRQRNMYKDKRMIGQKNMYYNEIFIMWFRKVQYYYQFTCKIGKIIIVKPIFLSMDDPKKCQLDSAECGNYPPYPSQVGCVLLKNLQQNFGNVFKADVVITECDLICMRSKAVLNPDGLICGKHRFTLGKDYKPSTLCKFSGHPTNSKSKGLKVTWKIYNSVKSRDPDFVLGSLICKPCQININQNNKASIEAEAESEEDDIHHDPNFVPSRSLIDHNEIANRRKNLDSLTEIFGIERVRFQVNSDIENLEAKTLSYFRTKHQQFQSKITDTFCHLVAPGQEQKMKNIIENKPKGEDSVIVHLKKAFDLCITRKARCSVLMLIPKNVDTTIYSKSKICELFGCSMYEIEKARSICKLYGPCSEEPKSERMYSRLSFEKAQHFINFLFSTGLLQEVAYGTTKLKLDSGDKVTVGNTILNGIHEHAVKEYIVYCTEINYESLGCSTLRNILKKMKPHIRTKLAGINSFVVDGIEAFEVCKLEYMSTKK
jgi:hypothetical protein